MVDFITNVVLTPYVQAVLFFILVGLFFIQRRRFELVSSGYSWLRTIILLLLFLYFAWNWASEIPSSLRAASVVGMFFINLNMIYNIVLGNLNEKYKQALEAYGQDFKNKALLEQVWNRGKKFIYTWYIFDGLLSGSSPGNFLKSLASRQIPTDIQHVLAKYGVEKELVTSQKMVQFLTIKLNQAQELPQELKDILAQAIKQFGGHAWVQEQVNEFLWLAIKDPEKLYYYDWSETPRETK